MKKAEGAVPGKPSPFTAFARNPLTFAREYAALSRHSAPHREKHRAGAVHCMTLCRGGEKGDPTPSSHVPILREADGAALGLVPAAGSAAASQPPGGALTTMACSGCASGVKACT